jgi:pyruvate kinase
MRRTKIVCTLGPATEDEEVLRQLMLNGMNVARFNFSHSDHEWHAKMLEKVVKLRTELNLPIATILDTKGPEIRLGKFQKREVTVKSGDCFVLRHDAVIGDETQVSVIGHDLSRDVKKGDTILLDDGLVELVVDKIADKDIYCIVKNGGVLKDNKGVNVPNAELTMPYISKRDRADIIFGIQNGFDFIAASFVRSASDVLEIRRILQEHNCNRINIIAKIENRQGVDNIDEIIRVANGVMIGRGDLGVELPLEEVPVVQKMIIKKAYNAGKQVITATQMLESMVFNPRPTRAEAADVANAIYDGTSAVMLSGETAAGKYPVEAVATMARIAEKAESDINYSKRFKEREVDIASDNISDAISNAISHATCTTATDLGAAAIITVTKSGRTARMISKYRPGSPIIGCSTYNHICRQLNLSWGVIPLLLEEKKTSDELFDHAVEEAKKAGLVVEGEIVAITAGVPVGVPGNTNMIKVQVV